jgi:hypothetical protein
MRNALLIFLLLNVLAYAYQRWILEPSVIVEADFLAQDFPGLLLAETPEDRVVAVTLPADSAATDVADVGMTCIRIGPFPREQDAGKVRRALESRATRIDQTAEEGQVWVGHWVQVAAQSDRAMAEKVRQSLIGAGMEDAYIVSDEDGYAVSIGLYRQRSSANSIVERADALGYEINVSDRFLEGTNYWLRVGMAGNRTLRADEFQTDSGQILRTEVVPCRI